MISKRLRRSFKGAADFPFALSFFFLFLTFPFPLVDTFAASDWSRTDFASGLVASNPRSFHSFFLSFFFSSHLNSCIDFQLLFGQRKGRFPLMTVELLSALQFVSYVHAVSLLLTKLEPLVDTTYLRPASLSLCLSLADMFSLCL